MVKISRAQGRYYYYLLLFLGAYCCGSDQINLLLFIIFGVVFCGYRVRLDGVREGPAFSLRASSTLRACSSLCSLGSLRLGHACWVVDPFSTRGSWLWAWTSARRTMYSVPYCCKAKRRFLRQNICHFLAFGCSYHTVRRIRYHYWALFSGSLTVSISAGI